MVARKKVVIDPGHGGRDPGAVGPTGTQEKVITLAVGKMVAEILAPVADIQLTRGSDIALGVNLNADLQARADMANFWDADVFVSIHTNSAENRAAHGAEVYTTPGQGQADVLAESIVRAMEDALPELAFRKDIADGDSDKEARLAVLTRTRMPAVLVELAFISNPREGALLENPIFQARAALAVAQGVCGYLGVKLPVPSKWDPVAEIRKLRDDKIINGDHDPKDIVNWGEFATVINAIRK